MASTKTAQPFPAFRFGDEAPTALAAALQAQGGLAESFWARLRGLEPSLVNCYRRSYFLSADRRFRLTLDTDLRFFPVRDRADGRGAAALAERQVILELKFDVADADLAAAITNALPFRLTRYSKYVRGMELTHGVSGG